MPYAHVWYSRYDGRSREGAWIEMSDAGLWCAWSYVAPARERGLKFCSLCRYWCRRYVAPARERGLKSVLLIIFLNEVIVAPARERGLKSDFLVINDYYPVSRSREGAWIEMLVSCYR